MKVTVVPTIEDIALMARRRQLRFGRIDKNVIQLGRVPERVEIAAQVLAEQVVNTRGWFL